MPTDAERVLVTWARASDVKMRRSGNTLADRSGAVGDLSVEKYSKLGGGGGADGGTSRTGLLCAGAASDWNG